MRHALALPLIAALAIAGCSKGGVEAKNESAESVAKKVDAAGIRISPGRWESTMKIEKMEMPGLPPQAQAAMQKAMATSKTFASCLTPEEVNRPNAGFFGNHQTGCTYQHFTMEGGKIDAEMTCGRTAGQMHMTMQGTYDADTYSMRVSNQGSMGPGKTMSTTMAMTAHRVGECTGKEDS
jgi:Protein of unknown function (DUF3617)